MFADRLREIRLAQGLTLDDLADRMGGEITKQAISKYETGRAQPRPTTLVALARALGVQAHELMAELVYTLESLQFRVRAPLAPRARARAEAALKYRLEKRLRLEDRVGVPRGPRIPEPRVPVARVEDVEGVAARIRSDWSLGSGAIANLTDVLEGQSVHVFSLPGDGDFDGLAAIARTDSGEIRAVGIAENPDADGDRQRFNLAHALGHVVLDPDQALDEEVAANRFAGAFLLPTDMVTEAFGQRRKDVTLEELVARKKSWGVSIQCILHRLRDLEVISQTHYKWWWSEIDALGYRKSEPVRLPREVSSWELQRVARAQAEGIISREQAAAYLGESSLLREQPLERRALMKMSLADRRALMAEHAERLAEYYSEPLGEWMDGEIDEP